MSSWCVAALWCSPVSKITPVIEPLLFFVEALFAVDLSIASSRNEDFLC